MIRLDIPVIVEGKYDKITLENVVDATIISTNGFSIFKDKDKAALIRLAAKKCGGVIVVTDSDSAGGVIRSHLKQIVGDEAHIINVYIPQIKGKEKRKAKHSKEGFLGVEGMSAETILEAFRKSGISADTVPSKRREITKLHLFEMGLSGGENSSESRQSLLRFIGLPTSLSTNAMLDILNIFYSYDEFVKAVEKWQEDKIKN